ncbi:putative NS protein [rice transitory yellowing virus]|uniref:Phosphoprotein n=1 Tax=Rice yellow stunt virus TaxID=59380 RepID=PHOSP_RYSV|nr:putative NS protein [rice transitory yellowing virus]O70790.1 RecName: Full=Phosphoprotein; Short=Protein P; AltName: Full=Protein M1 [rice transitory yellowing virus]BAA25155.1 putative NS protein [rice transitory yellowing virus]
MSGSGSEQTPRLTRSSSRSTLTGVASGRVEKIRSSPKSLDRIAKKYKDFDPETAKIIRADLEETQADKTMEVGGSTQESAQQITGAKRPNEEDQGGAQEAAKRVNRSNKVNSLLTSNGVTDPAKSKISNYIVGRLNANNIEADSVMVAECTNIAIHAWKEGKKYLDDKIISQATTTIPTLITNLVSNANTLSNVIASLNNVPDKLVSDIRTQVENVSNQTGQKAAKRDVLLKSSESIYNNAVKESKVDFINNYLTSSGVNVDELRKDSHHYRTVVSRIEKKYTVLVMMPEHEEHHTLKEKVATNRTFVKESAQTLSQKYVTQ